MVKVTLYKDEGLVRGFKMNGHACEGKAGSDIVCAAASSAAYLVANTITEVIGIKAKPKVGEALMMMMLTKEQATKAQDILKGFEIHMRELEKAHPKNIKVIYGGVNNA
ncbi:MAG: ribosomal-processing cysteine protease Prp [Eubacteriales bacterium]